MSNAFRAAVERRHPDAMAAALHPDVVFHCPAVFEPDEGRATTMRLLHHLLTLFEVTALALAQAMGDRLAADARV